LEIKPELIVCDLHPEYLSSKWAKKQRDLPVIGAQHHHAHLASVMAENGVSEPVIGIILDGTGYGLDGSIWGGEILIGDAKDFIRYAYLEPVAMPGGTAAINNPWRMAVSNLYKAFGGEFLKFDLPFLNKIDRRDVSIIVKMIEKGINSPLTSSCGRLFDAVSAMLNIRNTVNYEAQAAIELEMAVDENHGGLYEEAVVNIKGPGAIPIDGLIRGIVDDIKRNVSEAVIASKFHQSLAEIFISVVKTAKQNSGKNKVALSGGVFQNDFFFTYMFDRLIDEGFDVLTHNKVPTNDGGLALGQVVIADAKSDMSQDHN
jgi:hydrogenase maturation protein HypF